MVLAICTHKLYIYTVDNSHLKKRKEEIVMIDMWSKIPLDIIVNQKVENKTLTSEAFI